MAFQQTNPLKDPAAEATLLWGCMQAPENFDNLGKLEPGDFSEQTFGALFSDVLSVIECGGKLTNQRMNEIMSGYRIANEPIDKYMQRMTIGDRLPSLQETADHVHELSLRRRLTVTLRRSIEEAENLNDLLPGVIERTFQDLSELTNKVESDEPSYYHEHVDRVIELLQTDGENEAISVKSTGIQALDDRIGGFAPGDVVVIGGVSGGGKSMLVNEIAMNFGLRSEGVFFATGEMRGEEIAARNVSSFLRREGHSVAYGEILAGKGVNYAMIEPAVRRAMAMRDTMPIKTIGPKFITVTDISRGARAWRAELQQQGKDLGLIVVDHIGLIKTTEQRLNNGDNANALVTHVSNSLAMLAREMRVPVLMCSQLKKGVEERATFKPTMNDLRDSNAPRQDANIGLLVHWPMPRLIKLLNDRIPENIKSQVSLDYRAWANDKRHPDRAIAHAADDDPSDFEFLMERVASVGDAFEIIVGKHRAGAQGTAMTQIDAPHSRIY